MQTTTATSGPAHVEAARRVDLRDALRTTAILAAVAALAAACATAPDPRVALVDRAIAAQRQAEIERVSRLSDAEVAAELAR